MFNRVIILSAALFLMTIGTIQADSDSPIARNLSGIQLAQAADPGVVGGLDKKVADTAEDEVEDFQRKGRKAMQEEFGKEPASRRKLRDFWQVMLDNKVGFSDNIPYNPDGTIDFTTPERGYWWDSTSMVSFFPVKNKAGTLKDEIRYMFINRIVQDDSIDNYVDANNDGADDNGQVDRDSYEYYVHRVDNIVYATHSSTWRSQFSVFYQHLYIGPWGRKSFQRTFGTSVLVACKPNQRTEIAFGPEAKLHRYHNVYNENLMRSYTKNGPEINFAAKFDYLFNQKYNAKAGITLKYGNKGTKNVDPDAATTSDYAYFSTKLGIKMTLPFKINIGMVPEFEYRNYHGRAPARIKNFKAKFSASRQLNKYFTLSAQYMYEVQKSDADNQTFYEYKRNEVTAGLTFIY